MAFVVRAGACVVGIARREDQDRYHEQHPTAAWLETFGITSIYWHGSAPAGSCNLGAIDRLIQCVADFVRCVRLAFVHDEQVKLVSILARRDRGLQRDGPEPAGRVGRCGRPGEPDQLFLALALDRRARALHRGARYESVERLHVEADLRDVPHGAK